MTRFQISSVSGCVVARHSSRSRRWRLSGHWRILIRRSQAGDVRKMGWIGRGIRTECYGGAVEPLVMNGCEATVAAFDAGDGEDLVALAHCYGGQRGECL
jgi:hypothetical protein